MATQPDPTHVSPIRREFCTAQEAAKHIGCDRSQITRYVENGLLGAVKLGNRLFLKWTEVRRFERPQRGNPNFRKVQKV